MLTRPLALGAVALLAVAGGGVAYAATSRSGGPLPFGGPRFELHRGFGPGGPPPFGLAFGIGLDAAARYLGLSRTQLHQRLAAGQTLADVAKAQGKSVDDLVQALVDAAKAKLEQAVKDGKLTAEQRDAIVQDLERRTRDLVQRTGPMGGPCGPGGPGGHMGFRFRQRDSSGGSPTAPGSFSAPVAAAVPGDGSV